DGDNCKQRIVRMLGSVIDDAVERFLDPEYGPAEFAEFAGNRLGVDFDAANFLKSNFEEAENTARDKATRQVQTQAHELIEENLGAGDQKEWNWQALANTVNARWGLKTSDRGLEKDAKDNLTQVLIEAGEKGVAAIDLSAGRPFLEEDWGLRSLCDWAKRKFRIELTVEALKDQSEDDIAGQLKEKVRELYQQKETEFPVQVGMAR